MAEIAHAKAAGQDTTEMERQLKQIRDVAAAAAK